LAGAEGGGEAGLGVDAGLGGDVAGPAEVFGEGGADHRLDQQVGDGFDHVALLAAS
jgi:hypothetical protein